MWQSQCIRAGMPLQLRWSTATQSSCLQYIWYFFWPHKKNIWCCAKMFNWSSLQCGREGSGKGSERWNLYLYFSLYLYFWDSETNPVFAKVVLQQGRVQPNGFFLYLYFYVSFLDPVLAEFAVEKVQTGGICPKICLFSRNALLTCHHIYVAWIIWHKPARLINLLEDYGDTV